MLRQKNEHNWLFIFETSTKGSMNMNLPFKTQHFKTTNKRLLLLLLSVYSFTCHASFVFNPIFNHKQFNDFYRTKDIIIRDLTANYQPTYYNEDIIITLKNDTYLFKALLEHVSLETITPRILKKRLKREKTHLKEQVLSSLKFKLKKLADFNLKDQHCYLLGVNNVGIRQVHDLEHLKQVLLSQATKKNIFFWSLWIGCYTPKLFRSELKLIPRPHTK